MSGIGVPELVSALIVIAIWVLFVALVVGIARRKGYSTWVWAILAMFFSWIALIIVLVLPSRSPAPPPDY